MSANQPVIIKRRVRRDFTILPNNLIRDRRLSWKALGLLAYILSLPENYELNLEYLAGQKKDRRDGTRTGLKELECTGYLTIRQERGEHGKFGKFIWEVTDEPNTCTDPNSPVTDFPNPVNQNSAKPDSESTTLINTNSSKELNIKNTTTNRSVITSESDDVVVDDLDWPKLLIGKFSASAVKIIKECPRDKRQLVLDEISGLSNRGDVRSPLGLLHKLVQLAKQGQFVPNAALEYQKQIDSKAKATELREKEKKRLQDCISPQARESAKSHISELRKKVNI